MHESDRVREEIRAALSDAARVMAELKPDWKFTRQARGVLGPCVKCGNGHKTACCSYTVKDGALLANCFSCAFGGDVYSIVAAAEGLTDFPAVLERAGRIAGIHVEPRVTGDARAILRAVPAGKPDATDLSPEWAALPDLTADAWEYLRGRNLDGAASLCRSIPPGGASMRGTLLGSAEERVPWAAGCSFAVALRDASGRIVGIQARNLGLPHTFRVVGASKAGLFGEPTAVAGAANVVICEGMTDTLAAICGMRGAKSTAIVGIAGTNNRDALFDLPLKGKRVFVAMDADSSTKDGEIKGEEAAKLIAIRVSEMGGRPVRLRPEGGKDLADMHAAGVDLYSFARAAIGKAIGFRSAAIRIKQERALRMADAGKALSFGVRFLDLALGGIVPRDIILVGAESGMGKTQLATLVSRVNTKAGKNVYYFALEPEPFEVERRIKYQHLARMIFAARLPGCERLNFQAWHDGLCEDITGPYEGGAEIELAKELSTLHTFYRSEKGGEVTAADFDRMARAIAEGGADVQILDHVHYFDDGDDPNREQKRTGRSIRDLAIETGIPVFEIAHLRKKASGAKKNPRLLPERDDFEGSSHLFKPVKKAIILGPARDQKGSSPWKWPTYIAIVKNTLDGSRCRYVALVEFNARTNTYEDDFVLGEFKKNGEEFAPLDYANYPEWAKAR